MEWKHIENTWNQINQHEEENWVTGRKTYTIHGKCLTG